MANSTRTYKTTDWVFKTWKNDAGKFVLDISVLNGTDVLGTSTGSLTAATNIVAFTLNDGSAVSQGVFVEYSPSTLDITLSTTSFTPAMANSYVVGTLVSLELKNGETVGTDYTMMFYGRITDVTFNPSSDSIYTEINIQATDLSTNELNLVKTVSKNTTSPKSTILGTNGITSSYHYATTGSETKPFGEFIQDFQTCEMAIPTIYYRPSYLSEDPANPAPTRTWYYDQGFNFVSSVPTGIVIGQLTDTQINNIQFGWSGGGSPTAVNLTNYFNNSIVYQYGSDTNTIGAVSYSNTIDVKDLTEMTTIGQRMLSMSKKFVPVSVSYETARNNENITFIGVGWYNSFTSSNQTKWLYPAFLANPGDQISVSSTKLSTSEVMFVTGRTIEVNAENWITTYNLWKGFTS